MENVQLKIGDKVTRIKPMSSILDPEGSTDYNGDILPVLRDKIENGRLIDLNYRGYTVRPDWAEDYKDKACGENYYDRVVDINDKTLKKIQ